MNSMEYNSAFLYMELYYMNSSKITGLLETH